MIPSRKCIEFLHDYVPGKSIEEIRELHGLQTVIKLASNENPLGPSPKALESFQSSLHNLHLYPRGDCPQLRTALSHNLQVPEDRLILGNGSDEVISFICFAYLEPGLAALSCKPTFAVYESATRLMGAEYRALPLKDWKFDLEALAQAITPDVRVIFVCNPNNPTGTWVTKDEINRFMAKVPPSVLVVVDQAYCEFADDSEFPLLVDELDQYPNLLLLRTFSKIYGLAGARVGYGIGHPEVIAKLWKVKPPFNVNLPAQAAATAAVGDSAHLTHTLEINAAGKLVLEQGLRDFGFKVLPTQANFLAFHVGATAPKLVSWLEQNGMIVRGLKSFGIPEWIRVTVGLATENQRFLELLGQAKQQGVIG